MARQALASTKERNKVTKHSQRCAPAQNNKRSGDDRGTRFTKGQSGNPRGRPKGIKDRRVKYRELLEPHASELVKKAVELALAGDTTSLRLCLERIVPSIKSQDEPVKLSGRYRNRLPQLQARIFISGLPGNEWKRRLYRLWAEGERIDQVAPGGAG